MTANQSAPPPPSMRGAAAISSLRIPAIAYAVGLVSHGADHALRGAMGNHHDVAWPGSLQIAMGLTTVAIAATMLTLVMLNNRRAPVVAMLIGFGSAALFLGVHLSPAWATVVDSFVEPRGDAHVTAYSWLTAAVGVTASLYLGIAGFRCRK